MVVEDNGVGMKQANIDEILNLEGKVATKSFRLRGTIERIKLFYCLEKPVEIESKQGVGTKISITVPIMEVHTDGK